MPDNPENAETRATTASVFGVLRNLADTEPIVATGRTANTCALCLVRSQRAVTSFPHLARCPWVAARNIVGEPANG